MEKQCYARICQPLEAYLACPDQEMIEYLVKTCYSCSFQCLYPYIRTRTPSGEKACEVFNQSWENLIRRLYRVSPVTDVNNYLYRTADNILDEEEE